MSKPSKEYMVKYRKDNEETIKEQDRERARRRKEKINATPETRSAYLEKRRDEYLRIKPNARTAKEVQSGKRIFRSVPKSDVRTCIDCGETKPIGEFPRHGPRGREAYCESCGKTRRDKTRNARNARNASKRLPRPVKSIRETKVESNYDALERRVKGPKSKFKLKDHRIGWTLIMAATEGGMTVWHREGVLRFSKPGGVCRYGVMGDDNGGYWSRLDKAEKARDRVWRK